MTTSRKSGFTLIEISIVLVIIGLVVGAVLVGQDLIRSAEIRSVLSQSDQYRSAFNTFKLKYNCIPGDCVDESTFLTGVVNGNGDGIIGNSVYGGIGTAYASTTLGYIYNSDEGFALWKALGLAGLIPQENFYGLEPGSARCNYDTVHGCPHAKTGDAWRFQNIVIYTPENRLMLMLGNDLDGNWNFSSFSSTEALLLDKKIDDGLPATGRMMASGFGGFWGGATNILDPNGSSACVSEANPIIYDTASTYKCKLFFLY